MNINIDRKLLTSMVNSIKVIAKGNKSIIHALSNIVISGDGKYLSLYNSDLESSIKVTEPIDDHEPFKFLIDSRRFINIITLSDKVETIKLSTETEGNYVIVSSGRSKNKLISTPIEEYPEQYEYVYNTSVEVNSLIIKNTLSQVIDLCAVNDVRQYLNGIYFNIGHDFIRAVATNGIALAESKQQHDFVLSNASSCIIPKHIAAQLISIIGKKELLSNVFISNNNIKFVIGNIEFSSILIHGKYIDYDRVIPKNNKLHLYLNKKELLESIERVSYIFDKKKQSKHVHLQLNQNKMVIECNDIQEESVDELSIDYDGEEYNIKVNADNIIPILNIIDSDSINIFFNKDDNINTPILIHGDDNSYRYVAMPVKL